MTEPKLAWLLRRIRRSAAPSEGHLGDAELLQRFGESGDPAAFELIVWRHQRLVFGVCRRVLRDFHDAEDALQATFLILARKVHSIGRGEALAGWLYRVAYRVAIAARQGRARRRQHQVPIAAAAELARIPSLDGPAEQGELWAAIDDEVSRLPAKFRAATVLCYLQGKTVDEAARQLGCPRGTVSSRLARARERLRGQLTRRGITLTAGAIAAALSETVASASAPDRLVEQMMRAIGSSGASGAASGLGVSTQVTALTQEVLRMMLVKKIATSSALLLAFVGTFLLGAGVAVRTYASDGAEQKLVAEEPQAPAGPVGGDKERAAPSEPLPVSVSRPVRCEFTPYHDFNGHLESPKRINVQLPPGATRMRMVVNRGAEVKKDDPLFEFWTGLDRQELTKLQNALAQLDQQRQVEERVQKARKLFETGALSQGELDLRINEKNAWEKTAKDAQTILDRARQSRALSNAVAPVSGKVVMTDGLVTIVPSETIGLHFDMDERTYLQFRRLVAAGKLQAEGSTLSVGMSDEEGFPEKAVLQRFDPEFDAASGAIGVHCVLTDPEHIRLPGMFARVRIPMGKPRQVLEVPQSAVRPGAGGHVWVVNKQNIVENREVKLGQWDGKMLVIEGGLQADDWVILSIPDRLQNGARVDPRPKLSKPD